MAEENGTHLGTGANSEHTEDRTNVGLGSEVGLQTEDRTKVGFGSEVGLQREDRSGAGCESDVGLQRETRRGLIERIKMFKIMEFLTWRLVKTVVMGQGLAALICGTAITSQYLATEHQVDAPMLQSFFNYALLCLTYTTTLLFRKGDGNILQILRRRWWKYLLVGLVDVEANYAVVKAYQYTTLTSIQLLDSFVIPILMILSCCVLKTRYKPVHYVAVCICLLGVGAMVGADLLAGRDQGSTSNILLGDGLVLVSASLYAVSNVCQEYTVKNLGRVEFLGMMGLFGTLISGAQMLILERESIASILWNWRVGLLFSGYGLCMYTLYSCMPIVVKMTSATSVNLSLLTADIFALFCGLFLFHYTFSGLYIMSLVLIIIGFVTFNAVPTPSNPADTPDPSDPTIGYDDPTPVFTHDVTKKDVAVNITSEDQPKKEDEESAQGAGLSCQPPAEGGIVARSGGRSTKM